MFKLLKKLILNKNLLQPVLTFILVALLIALIFQFVSGRQSSGNQSELREVTRKVTFDEAVNKYLSNSYLINTKGSLIIKDFQNMSTPNSSDSDATKKAEQVIKATENKYNDLFFYSDKGVIKKLDFKTYGQNESLLINDKNEIVYLNNARKEYTLSPVPNPTDKNKVLIYDSTKKLFNDLLPLVSLVKDYKENKFYPVERATNIYSGKWQHELFTSNEVVDVFLETDPTSGSFRSFSVVHSFSGIPSQIYFDFIPQSLADVTKVPSDYKKL